MGTPRELLNEAVLPGCLAGCLAGWLFGWVSEPAMAGLQSIPILHLHVALWCMGDCPTKHSRLCRALPHAMLLQARYLLSGLGYGASQRCTCGVKQ